STGGWSIALKSTGSGSGMTIALGSSRMLSSPSSGSGSASSVGSGRSSALWASGAASGGRTRSCTERKGSWASTSSGRSSNTPSLQVPPLNIGAAGGAAASTVGSSSSSSSSSSST